MKYLRLMPEVFYKRRGNDQELKALVVLTSFVYSRMNEGKKVKEMRGTVKTIKRENGYGFIRSEEGSDIFFHASRLENIEFEDLTEGQTVEYQEAEGQKGIMAVNVTIVK